MCFFIIIIGFLKRIFIQLLLIVLFLLVCYLVFTKGNWNVGTLTHVFCRSSIWLWPNGGRDLFIFFALGFKFYLCTPVIPAVPYILIGLIGYLASPGISCGACITQTPRVTKKKICEL